MKEKERILDKKISNLKSKKITKKKILQEKGITLIALVVTIIILLILAGVTLNMALSQNGLFSKTKEAAEKYKQAQNEELENINSFSIYLQQLIAKGEMSEKLLELEAGDYIKYESNQKDKNGADIMWRVLYPVDSEYGLQIISDKNVEDITIGGDDWETAKESYNNAIKTLNNESMKYVNTDYAVDARCVGTNPANKKEDGTTNYILPEGYELPEGWKDDRDTGCLANSANHKEDLNTLKEHNMRATGEAYWDCQRIEFEGVNHDIYTYRIGSVDENGDTQNPGYQVGIKNTGELVYYKPTHGLRPCITLRYDVKIKSGDGKSESTAYELEMKG